MPDAAAGWLRLCTDRFRPAVSRCAAGEIPANVAVMHLLIEAQDPGEAESALLACIAELERGSHDGAALRRLRQALIALRNNPRAFAAVRRVIDDVDHASLAASPDAAVAHWAALFDRAARANAEGGVALYALGNPELLREATNEVVARMREWGLVGPRRAIAEIGCGIGRFQEALAPEVALCVGLDISIEMLARAARRCTGLPNTFFVRTSGRDLAALRDRSFDLVLAVDSFPYLVQSGLELALRHVEEAGRVLKPGGALLILNFSYRGDVAADRRDLARAGVSAGLELTRGGTRPFALWDGAAFELRKRA